MISWPRFVRLTGSVARSRTSPACDFIATATACTTMSSSVASTFRTGKHHWGAIAIDSSGTVTGMGIGPGSVPSIRVGTSVWRSPRMDWSRPTPMVCELEYDWCGDGDGKRHGGQTQTAFAAHVDADSYDWHHDICSQCAMACSTHSWVGRRCCQQRQR